MKIINKINKVHSTVKSNLVYPIERGYYYVCRVDKEQFRLKLSIKFNLNKYIGTINNKYAIIMDGYVYYNHDGIYWLIAKNI